MSESGGEGARSKLRIENLSDLVFGLALSIGSIILISKLPQSPDDLVSSVVLFGFSFLIVIWIWSGYTRTMNVLPFEVKGTFALNVVLLFCVALEPYLFYVMQQSPDSLISFSSSAYAVDSGSMMFILSGLVYLVLREEKSRVSRRLPVAQTQRLRRVMKIEIVVGALFLSSALPIFWVLDPFGMHLRFDFWYVSFAVFFIPLFASRSTPQAASGNGDTPATTSTLSGQGP